MPEDHITAARLGVMAGRDEVYSFDLAQSRAHDQSCQPAFVNLQQF